MSKDMPPSWGLDDGQAVTFLAAKRVLLAGMHLMLNGYGRMALLPYEGPNGNWRCEFHVEGRPSRVLYRYTSAAGTRYLANHAGGRVPSTISDKRLASAIMASVPEHLKAQCAGELSEPTFDWVYELGIRIDSDPVLPSAFHEYSEPGSPWEMVSMADFRRVPWRAPPTYVSPGMESPVEDEGFWRSHLAGWETLRERTEVSVSPSAIDNDQAIDRIGEMLRDAMLHGHCWEAGALFKMALKSALVALQPIAARLDPGRLIDAMRRCGLTPTIVSLGSFHMVDWPLSEGGSVSEEADSVERLRRLVLAIQLVGLEPSAETLALIEQLRMNALVECLLAERTQGKFSAQKLATDLIKHAKGG